MMPRHHARTLTRRTFLADLGRGTIALAVVGIAGCVPGASSPTASGAASGARPSGTAASPEASASAAASAAGASLAPVPEGAAAWHRVNLGFVSAYVLVRGGEAAIVDTGVAGSDDEIGAALEAIGLGWDAVGHLILTHQHMDHIGSAENVLLAASDAMAYAGAADMRQIHVSRPLTAAEDGDVIFGLRVVATPGHTAGSISVLDEIGGVFIAGDALRTDAGKPVRPGGRNTADSGTAVESVAKIGGLSFETLLVGHGDPILTGASGLVAALAAEG